MVMMKKIIISFLLMSGLIVLNACGFFGKDQQTESDHSVDSANYTEAPSDTIKQAEAKVTCHLDDALEKNKADFSRIESIVIDKGGREMLFWADQKLDGIKLSAVSYEDSSDSYIENNVLFESDALDTGEALSITAYLPDVMSNLRVSFSFSGKQYAYLLADSGKDGSLLLLPDEN